MQGNQRYMKTCTEGENPLECNSVATVLAKQETRGYMRAFTLGKSCLNVNSVASVLTLQEA